MLAYQPYAGSHQRNVQCRAAYPDSRRAVLHMGLGALLLAAAGPHPATARESDMRRERFAPVSEVDSATNPYVQELLRRTEAKREERKAARLKDYYRRNFKEYFDFEAADPNVAARRGIKPETQAKIAKWLEDNK